MELSHPTLLIALGGGHFRGQLRRGQALGLRARHLPLAFYIFTSSKETERKLLDSCSFGGGCINDTIIHLATSHMPFGGVGDSGMGSYHGKKSFDTFTHERSIVKKSTWLDLPMRYHPYGEGKLKLIRKFMK